MKKTNKIFIPSPENLWSYIVEKGREIESGYDANKFDKYDVETILGTMDFFGASDIWMKQTAYDLYGPPKYRLFDWLAMCVDGRNDDAREQNNTPLRVLIFSWLKVGGDPLKFIQDLRDTDYQIVTNWEQVNIS